MNITHPASRRNRSFWVRLRRRQVTRQCIVTPQGVEVWEDGVLVETRTVEAPRELTPLVTYDPLARLAHVRRDGSEPDWRKCVQRDGWACYICGKPADVLATNPGLRPTHDHLIPVKWGGSHTMANSGMAHHHCNAAKGDHWGYLPGVGQVTFEQWERLGRPLS